MRTTVSLARRRPPGSVRAMQLTDRYRVHPSAAVRPEPFGALVYHYGNRKLVFLKSPQLRHAVDALDGQATIAEAFDAVGVPTEQHERYLHALASLERSDMIELVEAGAH
jgi:mycofactocin biosynthesis protein MftB